MGGRNVGNTNIADVASVIVSTITSIGFVNLFDSSTTTMLSSPTNVEMLGYEASLQMRLMYNTHHSFCNFSCFNHKLRAQALGFKA
jgi:hypothetical protein